MDGMNVEGDAAIIWRQTGREGKRGMQDGGVRKNATAWTFKRTLERGWTLERENERSKS